jgi:transposase-like protein
MKKSTAKKRAYSKGQNIAQLAREKGIDPNLVYGRLHKGWTLARALSEPKRPTARKKAEPKVIEQPTAVTEEPPVSEKGRDFLDTMLFHVMVLIVAIVIALIAINE